MQNHTNSFSPPSDGQMPDGKQAMGAIGGIFLLVVMVMSNPWLMLVRKFGTVGTRATWIECGLSMIVLMALSQSVEPLRSLFVGTLFLMPILFFAHIICTSSKKQHVHTLCLGTPRFGSEFLEFLLGAATGLSIVFGWPEAAPFGWYIFACAAALGIRGMMLEERDRQRSVQMDDALWEQDYMMRNYEKFKKSQS